MKRKQEIIRIAQKALMNEFGFSPALNNITLLEASGDGTYILFNVSGHVYRFESYLMEFGDDFKPVWVGPGTISRC